MTNKEDDIELDEIIKRSSDRAQREFPNRTLSFLSRVGVALVGMLIAFNSVVSIYNTRGVIHSNQCEQTVLTTLSEIATNDRGVIDSVVNTTLTATNKSEIVNALADYNRQRSINEQQRQSLLAKNCR